MAEKVMEPKDKAKTNKTDKNQQEGSYTKMKDYCKNKSKKEIQ